MAKAGVLYGDIDGVVAPQEFENRKAAFDAGVHRQTQAGISGGAEGVDAVCLSNGYADDVFDGDLITYTGFGGRDADTRRQVADQQLIKGNLGLVRNCELGRPVRVLVKKSILTGRPSDSSYVYVGLYKVVRWDWGRNEGLKVLVYQLQADAGQTAASLRRAALGQPYEGSAEAPGRREVSTHAIVRDYRVAAQVKEIYADRCQVCKTQLLTAAGSYSEAAHIRPLGSPHHGKDTLSNILCLCPNCHKLLDGHALTIGDDYRVLEMGERKGKLVVDRRHTIDVENLRYQRFIAGMKVNPS